MQTQHGYVVSCELLNLAYDRVGEIQALLNRLHIL